MFTASANSANDSAPSAMPNHSAERGSIRPDGSGRRDVRVMRASMSRSM